MGESSHSPCCVCVAEGSAGWLFLTRQGERGAAEKRQGKLLLAPRWELGVRGAEQEISKLVLRSASEIKERGSNWCSDLDSSCSSANV